MSAFWVLIPFAPVALLMVVMGAWSVREARNCKRLNAEADAHAEAWRHLTDEDRAWLLENGGTRPSLTRWEMR